MKKILVVGAGFLQKFVIKKAKDMGYTTLAVDADPNAEGFCFADKFSTIDIVDEKACLEFAQKEKIDGVLTAATDYGVLTAAYVAEKMNLPGLAYETARLLKNKYRVRKCLFENHVDDNAQAYEIDDHTDLEKLKNKLLYPVMVKPCDGSGSRGATKVEEREKLTAACKFAMDASMTNKAEIETFIDGKEYGAEILVVNGKPHVLGVMRKWMTNPPYYAELGHAMPTDLSPELEKRVKEYVCNAIYALGIRFGSVNMDMLITTEGKIHIIDVGARMGGNMIGPCVIPYGTGIDYMANMIRNAAGDEVDFTAGASVKTAVVTRVFAFNKGVVRQLPDFNTLAQKYSVEIYHHMKQGDVINEYHTNIDGCGYVVARAEKIETALSNAEAIKKIIAGCIERC